MLHSGGEDEDVVGEDSRDSLLDLELCNYGSNNELFANFEKMPIFGKLKNTLLIKLG